MQLKTVKLMNLTQKKIVEADEEEEEAEVEVEATVVVMEENMANDEEEVEGEDEDKKEEIIVFLYITMPIATNIGNLASDHILMMNGTVSLQSRKVVFLIFRMLQNDITTIALLIKCILQMIYLFHLIFKMTMVQHSYYLHLKINKFIDFLHLNPLNKVL